MFNSTITYSFESAPTLEDFVYGPESLKRITGVMGPFGSGKSSACIMKILHISLNIQQPGPDGVRRTRWAIVRNTNKELRDTTIRTVKDWLPPTAFGRFYETVPHNYIITAWKDAEIELMFRALDRAEQVKDLLSAEYTGAWFNEYREINEEVYNDNIHYAQEKIDVLPHNPLLLAFDFGLTPACVIVQQDVRGRVNCLEAMSSGDMGIRQFCQEVVKPVITQKYSHHKVIITGDPAGKEKSQVDKRTAYEEIEAQFPHADVQPFYTNIQKVRRDGLENLLMKMVDGKPAFQICGRKEESTKEGSIVSGVDGLAFLREGLISEFKYPKLQVTYDDMYKETPLKNFHSHVCEALEYGAAFIEAGSFDNTTADYGSQKRFEQEVGGWDGFV